MESPPRLEQQASEPSAGIDPGGSGVQLRIRVEDRDTPAVAGDRAGGGPIRRRFFAPGPGRLIVASRPAVIVVVVGGGGGGKAQPPIVAASGGTFRLSKNGFRAALRPSPMYIE
ncbi:hypothetical protein ACLOJK_029613 [Asimina triloba]